jgi:hypothetical protein
VEGYLPMIRETMNWGCPADRACKRTAPHMIAEPKDSVFRRPTPSLNSAANGKAYVNFQQPE